MLCPKCGKSLEANVVSLCENCQVENKNWQQNDSGHKANSDNLAMHRDKSRELRSKNAPIDTVFLTSPIGMIISLLLIGTGLFGYCIFEEYTIFISGFLTVFWLIVLVYFASWALLWIKILHLGLFQAAIALFIPVTVLFLAAFVERESIFKTWFTNFLASVFLIVFRLFAPAEVMTALQGFLK